MGLLDMLQGVTGQNTGPASANVAGGLMQALDEHPGGLGGLLQNFHNNGMSDHVQNWASGQQQQATPEQVQQGLGNTGFIENVAAKAGVSPDVARTAMATLLPIVIAHFTAGGQQTPPQSGYSGMASQILSKFL